MHRVNGVIVKIEGDPECPHNLGKQCAKGQAAIMTMYDANRVKTPLRRTNPEKGIGVDPKWEAICWEEALNIVCARLKKIRDDDPNSEVSHLLRVRVSFQLLPEAGTKPSVYYLT